VSHSPGPWKWEAAYEGADLWLRHSNSTVDKPLGDCVLIAEGGKWPPSAEDARLIASAPTLLAERDELLAALKWAMSILDAQSKCDEGCADGCSNYKARAIIDRIEGGK
jgi:hypothetical protein